MVNEATTIRLIRRLLYFSASSRLNNLDLALWVDTKVLTSTAVVMVKITQGTVVASSSMTLLNVMRKPPPIRAHSDKMGRKTEEE